MPAPVQLKYRAFLSYAHADASWGRWLHRQLESFRIDKELTGRQTELGPVPKGLRPIFRDREDFTGGGTLSEATIAALDASAALIVLCSTASAGRPAVNDEVRLFRSRHPERPVIPVIVDGTYPDNFPSALRFEVTPEGVITDRPLTILGSDLRETGDGKSLALAKVVAGLTGVSPDDLYRRAERARRRSVRFRNTVIAVLALLVAAAGGSAYLFREELKRNETLLDRTLERATALVSKSVSISNHFGVPRALSLGLLIEAERMFIDMSELGSDSPKLIVRKAQMYIEFARAYEALGQSEEQRKRASDAETLMVRLLERDPHNMQAQWYQATALTELGDALRAQGLTDAAFQSHQSALRIALTLHRARPTRQTAFAVRVSLERSARIDAVTGNLPRAIESAKMSLTIAESLSMEEPHNMDLKESLSSAHTDLGDAFLASGNMSTALEHHQKALAIDRALAATTSRNISLQRALGVSYERIANLQGATGDFVSALDSFHAAKEIADTLSNADPANTALKNNVVVGNIGDTHLALGQFLEAKSAYIHALGMRRGLTKLDPANNAWQFELAVNYFRAALVEALAAASDTTRAIDIAKALYALKTSLRNEELSVFSQLTVMTFAESKANQIAKQQLGEAVAIMRQMRGGGRLPDHHAMHQWGQIFEAAYAAMVQNRD